MKIKKASASFGKLNGDTLELADGLNIVNAPNESGKSTWCAFIRTMLYGLNTADRDKIGYLSDKTKYRPWNEKPMEGSMDITHDGKDITIQRTALGKAPMKDFSAVITGTDISVPGINGENAGQVLTGVTKPVFERSAFIRQSGMQVAQTSDLEKRIASIVSSGDESVSYSDADKKLRAWTRRRKHNASVGTIPALQAKIKEKLDAVERIRHECEESANLRTKLEQLTAEKELLERELIALDSYEEILLQKKLEQLRRDAVEKELKVKACAASLDRYGKTDDETLTELRADLTAMESFENMETTAEAAYLDAMKALENAENEAGSTMFRSMSVQEADDLCDDAEHLEEQTAKSKKTSKNLTLIFAVLAVITAVAGFLLSSPLNIVLWAVAAACVIALVCIISASAKSAKLLREVLSKYRIEDTKQFRAKVEEYTGLRAKEESAKAVFASAESAYNAAKESNTQHVRGMLDNARLVDAKIRTVQELQETLNTVAQLKAEYQAARSSSDMASALYKAKEADYKPKAVTPPDITPRYDRKDTLAAITKTAQSIEFTNAAYNMTLGRLKVLGDPMVLESEISSLRQELAEQQAQYDALVLAAEVLAQADNEIHTRFAPVLSKTAGSIFHRITGGRYDMLAFDKTLDAAAQAKGDTVSKNVLFLSEGTSDQIYLSLRLAVCQLALDSLEPCPIILDDALASFDDDRLALALDYLKELASVRQIIVFSCHNREANYFANDPDVNIVSL
ncbi:MAG: AAA family ATPase [Oscillospiraceae bacterium]|nr:AAA family ATPase [Oscillospiraceae bacterium]